MEGEVTVICVDTSFASPDTICWYHDQIRSVKIYCEDKLRAHPDNLVGIVTSSQLHVGCLFAPTHSMATVTASLDALAVSAGEQEYECIDLGLLRGLALFRLCLFPQKHMNKRIVLFSSGSPFSTAGHSPEAIASFLKAERVALDVIDFGTQVMGIEDYNPKYLKALVDAMNDNNQNGDCCYSRIDDDGLSLSRHISSSSILPPLSNSPIMSLTEGEVTMICVDTSITSLCCFNDQTDAVNIYCERKLKAHPDNLVSIARFGQRDFGIFLDPTNCIEKVISNLGALEPRKQYTDLLEGLKLSRVGWSRQRYMKKRIVVFSGGPLLPTTGHSPSPEEAIALLKEERVVLDVIDFGTRVKPKEDCKAKYLKALVDAMNNNNENEDSRYFPIKDNGLSLSHEISSCPILPPLVPEEAPISRTRMKADIHSGGWFSLYNNHLWNSFGWR